MINTFLSLSDYIHFFLVLFAIVNPIGILPIFISMTNDRTMQERNKINLISNIAVAVILCISLLAGEICLKLFGISINSFRIAGGIIITMFGISMITGQIKEDKTSNQKSSKNRNSIAIVPLALPLMAGPGAISSCIVWASHWKKWQNLIGLCLITVFFTFFCWLIFQSATVLIKCFKKTGINIITRIMGLFLMSLGVELVSNGMKVIFC